jgi:hypothetical protein
MANLSGRILRYLASVSMIKETDEDNFAATNVTKALAIPGFQAGIHHKSGIISEFFHHGILLTNSSALTRSARSSKISPTF